MRGGGDEMLCHERFTSNQAQLGMFLCGKREAALPYLHFKETKANLGEGAVLTRRFPLPGDAVGLVHRRLEG